MVLCNSCCCYLAVVIYIAIKVYSLNIHLVFVIIFFPWLKGVSKISFYIGVLNLCQLEKQKEIIQRYIKKSKLELTIIKILTKM